MMTPEQSLAFLKPTFLDLFSRKPLDVSRFLRLVIEVLDPDPGYGPVRCIGDGKLHPLGCGEVSTFHAAVIDGQYVGIQCPKCNAIFRFVEMGKLPSRIVITSDGSSHVGTCKSESDSGMVIVDK